MKKIMLLGIYFFLLCIGINFYEHSFHHFAFSLILLGMGWNFLFISSTTLLTEKIDAKDQPRAQAINDFLATGFGALAVAVSGKIHAEIGWSNLNLITLPLVVITLFIVFKEQKN
jgi:MFS family permease